MKRTIQTRNKAFSPNLPKVQCRRMAPVTVDNVRFINRDNKTGKVTASGHAVKWESINYYAEKFVKGAFTEVCAAFANGTKQVHCYYNHGWRLWYIDAQLAMRIGKITKLIEDDIGLYLEIELTPNLFMANQVAAMVEHGTIDGFSIAFYPPNDIDVEDKGTHIEIKRADLYEISIVDEPADDAARIINDDTIGAIETDEDVEGLLRQILPGDVGGKLAARIKDLHKREDPESLNIQKSKPKEDLLSFLDDH